jgi:DNA-binding IclR family transcriptional regulator
MAPTITRTLKPQTCEHRRYTRHCQGCPVCQAGGQCRVALRLLIDADAADWRRFNPAATAARATNSEMPNRG